MRNHLYKILKLNKNNDNIKRTIIYYIYQNFYLRANLLSFKKSDAFNKLKTLFYFIIIFYCQENYWLRRILLQRTQKKDIKLLK